MPRWLKPCIKRALTDEERILSSFWPVSNGRAEPERNLTHALARQLQAKGFDTYFEVSFRRRNARVDLVAVKWGRSPQVVLVEAKNLWFGTDAPKVARDFEKLRSFDRFRGPWDTLPKGEAWCLVLASCWRERLRDWWMHPETGSHPKGSNGIPGWRDLQDELLRPEVAPVAFEGKEWPGSPRRFLLAAVWERPRDR
jgi:hypothetical protein